MIEYFINGKQIDVNKDLIFKDIEFDCEYAYANEKTICIYSAALNLVGIGDDKEEAFSDMLRILRKNGYIIQIKHNYHKIIDDILSIFKNHRHDPNYLQTEKINIDIVLLKKYIAQLKTVSEYLKQKQCSDDIEQTAFDEELNK